MLRQTRAFAVHGRRALQAFSTEAAAAGGASTSAPAAAVDAAAAPRWQALDDLQLPSFVKIKSKEKLAPMTLTDAIARVQAGAGAKFDETVELSLALGIDPRRGDQMVRGATQLPHGTGRSVRVAVFAGPEDVAAAREAGADIVGGEDLIAGIAGGAPLDFDKAVATPGMMPKIGRVARILGPRGLMPNPKLGTVTANVAEAVTALKRGKVEFRADKGGVVHAGLGKVSFEQQALASNVATFFAAIVAAKPKGVKGGTAAYIKSATLSSTMGKGVPVTVASLSQAAAAVQA